MNYKTYLILALGVFLAFGIFGCQPKETGEETSGETVEVTGEETEVVDIAATETPDAAGKDVLTPPADTARVQILEGLQFAHTMVGWNNALTVSVIDVTIAGLDVVATGSTDDAEKAAIAQAKQDLMGAKGNLENAISGTELTKEDLEAVKSTIKDAYNTLKAIWEPAGGGGTISEAEGDKLKEGHKAEGDKLKEGHEAEGDKLKEKWGEREGK